MYPSILQELALIAVSSSTLDSLSQKAIEIGGRAPNLNEVSILQPSQQMNQVMVPTLNTIGTSSASAK